MSLIGDVTVSVTDTCESTSNRRFTRCVSGQARHVVPGPIQAGQAARRDDDRAADGGDAQLSDRTDGDAAVLPVDQHAEDVGHGTGVLEQRGVQRQRQHRDRFHGRLRRRGGRVRHAVRQGQRERNGAHHVARVRRHDTHETAQRRRPVQNGVRNECVTSNYVISVRKIVFLKFTGFFFFPEYYFRVRIR